LLEQCRDLARSLGTCFALPDLVVYLRGRSGDLLQVAAFGDKCAVDGSVKEPLVLRESQGIVGHAASSRSAVNVRDVACDVRYIVDDGCRRAELSVPIVHGHRVLGVVDAEHSQVGYFRESHCSAFVVATQLVAPSFARLLESEGEAPRISSPEAFDEAVRHALRHLGNPRRLERCELASCALVSCAVDRGEHPAVAIRSVLLDTIEAMAMLQNTAAEGGLLQRRFVARAASQELLAERLHVGTSTLRRHVRRATDLLGAQLWTREQQLRR
jgi:GAF domain